MRFGLVHPKVHPKVHPNGCATNVIIGARIVKQEAGTRSSSRTILHTKKKVTHVSGKRKTPRPKAQFTQTWIQWSSSKAMTASYAPNGKGVKPAWASSVIPGPGSHGGEKRSERL